MSVSSISYVPSPLPVTPLRLPARIPTALAFDTRLSRRNAVCLRVLVGLHAQHGDICGTFVRPDVPQLATLLGYQTPHVYRAIRQLAGMGYLDVRHVRRRLIVRAVLSPRKEAV